MYREAEKTLNSWLCEQRRKPLVIRGARQVGKSTLIRNFAKNNNLSLYEINLERYPQLDNVFKSLDLNLILRELGVIVKKNIEEKKSLLFLDEIQAAPSALQALRYFYEDKPLLPVIAAGSLLEFTLADHNFSMPVGRIEYLHLGAMTFEEFVIAKKEDYLLELIYDFEFNKPIPAVAHKQLLDLQREYLFIGGMPEVVLSNVNTGQLSDVARVQNSIINTYQDDFAKYHVSTKELTRIRNVFNYWPRSIGQKVKYSNISKEDQSRDLKNVIDLLCKARIIYKIIHSSCSAVPLAADENENVYKPLFLDVGLINRICGLDWQSISVLHERQLVNEGSLAEQFIGQHLLYLKRGLEIPQVHYWLREQKSSNAEVDFVISINRDIIPIEVKAGKSGSLRSLHQFVLEKGVSRCVRFDLNPASIQKVSHMLSIAGENKNVSYELISLPLYLVGQLERLLK